jgi:hypothetical protein
MWIYIKVCGWQELNQNADSGNDIPSSRVLKVEQGA